jgi:nitroimidazol reductase NimA-like FMN-containing flavoprotein (pyridoxamine 5'-phosphate oxidase superfamily)
MSTRDLLRMTDDEVKKHIDECRRAQVATFNGDGSVQMVPILYVVLDGHLTFSTDPESRKVKNLRRDPRITCLVETGADFSELRAVQFVGHAEVIDDWDMSLRVTEASFIRHGGPMDEQTKAYAASLAGIRVSVIIKPERVVSWDHRKLPGVRPDQIGSTVDR